jgi:hypothetical protein
LSNVFISYAREDGDAARAVAEALQNRGISVFWDRSIPAGRSFEDVIESALAEAKAVVVLWSRHSVRSDWVRAEVAEGARRGILVPATLDGEEPPLRYRIAQTANLVAWVPADSAQSTAFVTFLDDVANTVAGPHAGHENRARTLLDSNRDIPPRDISRSLKASIAFAWLGSAALATTAAYDYGLVKNVGQLWGVAYVLTLIALICGAIASIALGIQSLRRQFVPGVLQGFVWPVLAAVGQLTILASAARFFQSLPFMSEWEGLLAFLLCGALGPGALTVGAVIVTRSLNRRW